MYSFNLYTVLTSTPSLYHDKSTHYYPQPIYHISQHILSPLPSPNLSYNIIHPLTTTLNRSIIQQMMSVTLPNNLKASMRMLYCGATGRPVRFQTRRVQIVLLCRCYKRLITSLKHYHNWIVTTKVPPTHSLTKVGVISHIPSLLTSSSSFPLSTTLSTTLCSLSPHPLPFPRSSFSHNTHSSGTGLMDYVGQPTFTHQNLKGQEYTEDDNPYANDFRPSKPVVTVNDEMNCGSTTDSPSSVALFNSW